MRTSQKAIIEATNKIIADYPDMKLTLRQVYYRLLSLQLFPNTRSSYQKLGKILKRARLGGEIAWAAIEDRTRKIEKGDEKLYSPADYFNSYYDYLRGLDRWYEMPRWWGQPKKVVVMVEKDALSSIFREVTKKEGVDLVSCKGYPSITLLYDLAVSLKAKSNANKTEILWFSDYDPSGKNIEETTAETLRNDFDVDFEIERVALTKEQVVKYQLPPAPAKTSDPRYDAFVNTEGVAWQVELDALEPRMLQELIRKAITKHYDDALGRKRDEELAKRKRRIKAWVDDAFNKDFQKPSDDEDENRS